jgi:hypothetical protein
MQRRPEKFAIPRRSGMDRSVSDRWSARGFAPVTTADSIPLILQVFQIGTFGTPRYGEARK